MGNLHEGHLELVRRARQLGDVVVVSIFVNPLQFGPGEDLDAYPRTLAADREKLFAEGAQFLYTPGVADIYPEGMAAQTIVRVPDLSETLCGSSRPGHFDGVTTVVSKLFNIVRPTLACSARRTSSSCRSSARWSKTCAFPSKSSACPPCATPTAWP
jgi:pantoate--beta-alanine ligase